MGEFVETLEAAMQVYLGGVGRVGRDLPRLSAYFSLFSRVNEVSLAEAMQTSIIKQHITQRRRRTRRAPSLRKQQMARPARRLLPRESRRCTCSRFSSRL